MKLNFHLDRVENIHEITVESEPAFWQLIQQGILLSLREAGQISEMQLRQAEDRLRLNESQN